MKHVSNLALVAAATIFLGLSSSAFAASVTHDTTREQFTDWPTLVTLDGTTCPQIPSGVQIHATNNERVRQTVTKTLDDGSKQIVVNDLVKGTAADNLGGAYTFVYQNHATFDVSADNTSTVKMNDTFALKGDNASYQVGFNWNWAFQTDGFDPPNSYAFPFVNVNEVYDFVPLSTRGDVLDCDPI